MGRLHCGPPRIADDQTHASYSLPHVLFLPRDPIDSGRACGTTRWYIRQLVQKPDTLCVTRFGRAWGKKVTWFGEGICLMRRACWLMRRSGLWKSGGVVPRGD